MVQSLNGFDAAGEPCLQSLSESDKIRFTNAIPAKAQAKPLPEINGFDSVCMKENEETVST